jgi:hypothetical protein
MKRLVTTMTSVCMLLTGCSTWRVNDDTIMTTTTKKGSPETIVKKHTVSVWKGSMLMNSSVDNADLTYGPVRLKMGGVIVAGDTATTRAIADGIIGGITAYFTSGASSVVKGVYKGMTSGSLDASTSDAGGGCCEVSGSSTSMAPASEEQKKETTADVQAGKFAVIVLGNRNGCSLCKGLWTSSFEMDVERALPAVDVIDADYTETRKLYDKYRPKGAFTYPWVVIYNPSGDLEASFSARGVDTQGFIEKVSAECKRCSVQ